MENSLISALKGTGLQDLPLIDSLSFVNNSIRSVAPDVFKGTENAILFDISYNLLTSLPPALFDTWGKLMKVVLSHNQLLHVDRLFAFARPKLIYLDFNNLTDLDSVLHPGMSNVETLLLSHNPFEKVTDKSFNEKVNSTRFLNLDHCQIKDFDVRHYSGLTILAILDLSYNEMETIREQEVNIGTSLELRLTGNQIREFNAELPFNVRRLYLDQNRMPSLGRTLHFSQMTEVSITENRIEFLSSDDFKGVHGLHVMDLHGNLIEKVHRLTFSSVRKDLEHLDLSRNRIKSLNGCVRYLSLLTSLNLTDNRIEGFEEGEFTGLNELTELYLEVNRIVTLSGQLQRLPQLQYLVISHNRIRSLKKEQIPDRLKYLSFEGNPFRCDCGLFPFLQYLNSSDTPGTDVPICLPDSGASNRTPPSIGCPEPCTCSCSNFQSGDHFMSVDCSSRDLHSLPYLFRSANATSALQNLAYVQIRLGRVTSMKTTFSMQGPFVISDEIGAVDLSNNSLDTLEGAWLPPTIRHLRIAVNRLRYPPLPTLLYSMVRLNRVTLSGNPWKCDCDTLSFKKWILSKTDTVADLNETRCGPPDSDGPDLTNRVIWSLSDLDLCPADIGFYISLAFGLLSFFLVAAALKILWTRYEMNVKVWLYSHGVTWVKEKDIDRDKKFDAFLSFSHKDEDFVIPHIIKVIEAKEPNVRLCVHYKDFRAGEFIHDNILDAVQNSKRTVLILTRNFLESEWCLMEFRAAHVQALKDRVHRIVVIKLGDLPKDIDPAIQVYLDSTTYLTWGEKYFWNNLLYVLPTSGPAKKVGPSITKGVCVIYPKITANPMI